MGAKNINWGIIGLGNIAEQFALDLSLVPNASLYAVASRSQTKASAFASSFKAIKAYGDYESLINDEQVDIIYIATPHNLHVGLSILALNAKKHVLCEKPVAINFQQASQMIEASIRNNCFFMEAFWTRFIPSFMDAFSKIKNGNLGKIHTYWDDNLQITDLVNITEAKTQEDQDIIKDEFIVLNSNKAIEMGVGVNGHKLRLVHVYKQDKNKVIEIIANNLECSARIIADL
jgi:hypothetical protein